MKKRNKAFIVNSDKMDPLGAISHVVEGQSLPTWHDLIPPTYPEPSIIRESKFPVRRDLNEKVSLW